MKHFKIILALFCSLILLSGCQDNGLALKINDKSYTKAEFNKLFAMDRRNKAIKMSKSGVKLSSNTEELKRKFADNLIKKTLLEQEYKKRNITASESDIEEKLNQTKKYFPSEEIFKESLKKQGITQEEFNELLANSVKMDKLINAVVKPKISDSEAEKFYKQNISLFTSPEKVRYAHILLRTNYAINRKNIVDKDKTNKLSSEEIDKIAKEETENNKKLLAELQKTVTPQNFIQIAKLHSQDSKVAQNGGDVGFVKKEDIDKTLADKIFTQKVGTIDPEIKSPEGSHIVLVLDRAAANIQPFENVKADIKVKIYASKKNEYLTNLYKGLLANSTIVYGDKKLKPKKNTPFINLF